MDRGKSEKQTSNTLAKPQRNHSGGKKIKPKRME